MGDRSTNPDAIPLKFDIENRSDDKRAYLLVPPSAPLFREAKAALATYKDTLKSPAYQPSRLS
jgi:hypothetical protein